MDWTNINDYIPEVGSRKDYNSHCLCLLDTGEFQVCFILEESTWESYEVNTSAGNVIMWKYANDGIPSINNAELFNGTNSALNNLSVVK
jgi:hypothetical protein